MFHYTIRPESDIPIYRQLVDQINAEIRSGVLKTGTQLPTVREMAERLNLSCGTVKRVYDRLQEMGDIEMTRRRGTFVKYVREDTDSRKLKAMTCIDLMLRQLSDLNLSPAEIQIFVGLKMREWGLKWSGVRVAVVTEYVEFAEVFREQLSGFSNVTCFVWPLKQVREYPYNVDEQSDVILASPEDAQRLQHILPDGSKMLQVGFGTDPESLLKIARCHAARIAVLCRSDAFERLVKGYLPEGCAPEVIREEQWRALENAPEAVILAERFGGDCPEELRAQIARMEEDGRVLRLRYGIDEGSLLYLEERIHHIREERQSSPGTLAFRSDR